MSLIIALTNDGTGTDKSANYRWVVYVNKNRLSAGRLTGHDRGTGLWALLAQLAAEQLGIAGAGSHSTKGEPFLGFGGEKAITRPLDTHPPDSAPGAMPTSLIEQGVFKYPPGMEGWRNYRIEYGGHAENCLCEGAIWLPPDADRDSVERFLRRMVDGQAP